MSLIYLLLVFTLVPMLELYLLIKVGQFIGAFNTVLCIILTGILGAIAAKNEGLRVLKKFQEDISSLRVPQDIILDGMLILAGGILLITPGFITDLLGFLLVLPFTRPFFRSYLERKIRRLLEEESITIYRL